MESWDWKGEGSSHYKTGGVEPIDLCAAGDMLTDFALFSIIKYAFRSRRENDRGSKLMGKDLDKIIDYAKKLKYHINETAGAGPFPILGDHLDLEALDRLGVLDNLGKCCDGD